ncbi:uncharacterized protein LOC129804188 isoform X2 [Phlebotomus papatasi]|uniref:uncharacterized protein LOC129804188 isoform X2 n=1 Tax=Phlebotomus papatasi TaxID=29031 RepID=UPI002483A180|nr:uncharacterized protein LOC129804188 isoform X2 [Phlebotomus papatasi]
MQASRSCAQQIWPRRLISTRLLPRKGSVLDENWGIASSRMYSNLQAKVISTKQLTLNDCMGRNPCYKSASKKTMASAPAPQIKQRKENDTMVNFEDTVPKDISLKIKKLFPLGYIATGKENLEDLQPIPKTVESVESNKEEEVQDGIPKPLKVKKLFPMGYIATGKENLEDFQSDLKTVESFEKEIQGGHSESHKVKSVSAIDKKCQDLQLISRKVQLSKKDKVQVDIPKPLKVKKLFPMGYIATGKENLEDLQPKSKTVEVHVEEETQEGVPKPLKVKKLFPMGYIATGKENLEDFQSTSKTLEFHKEEDTEDLEKLSKGKKSVPIDSVVSDKPLNLSDKATEPVAFFGLFSKKSPPPSSSKGGCNGFNINPSMFKIDSDDPDPCGNWDGKMPPIIVEDPSKNLDNSDAYASPALNVVPYQISKSSPFQNFSETDPKSPCYRHNINPSMFSFEKLDPDPCIAMADREDLKSAYVKDRSVKYPTRLGDAEHESVTMFVSKSKDPCKDVASSVAKPGPNILNVNPCGKTVTVPSSTTSNVSQFNKEKSGIVDDPNRNPFITLLLRFGACEDPDEGCHGSKSIDSSGKPKPPVSTAGVNVDTLKNIVGKTVEKIREKGTNQTKKGKFCLRIGTRR